MRIRRTVAGVALTTLSAGLLATIPFTAANAASANLVISQVYGGGGNSGATYTHDFVEIYNRGTTPVSSAGLSVQYAGHGTGNFTAGGRADRVPDAVPAGGYLLVQMAQGSGGTTPLPTPDASGTIAMSGTAGKVAWQPARPPWHATVCGDMRHSAASSTSSAIGTAATYFEGSAPTASLSNTTAALRALLVTPTPTTTAPTSRRVPRRRATAATSRPRRSPTPWRGPSPRCRAREPPVRSTTRR